MMKLIVLLFFSGVEQDRRRHRVLGKDFSEFGGAECKNSFHITFHEQPVLDCWENPWLTR
jgi:hypothetical protein